MTVIYDTIAKPYAIAAFSFAVEHSNVKHWQSMLKLGSEIIRDQHMVALLSAMIPAKKLANFFISIHQHKFDIYYYNLIRIMANNGRLAALPFVSKQFNTLLMEYESIIELNIISAKRLNKDQLTNITSIMRQRLSYKVYTICKIDKSIIGGIIVYIGNKMVIDASIRSRLNRLACFL